MVWQFEWNWLCELMAKWCGRLPNKVFPHAQSIQMLNLFICQSIVRVAHWFRRVQNPLDQDTILFLCHSIVHHRLPSSQRDWFHHRRICIRQNFGGAVLGNRVSVLISIASVAYRMASRKQIVDFCGRRCPTTTSLSTKFHFFYIFNDKITA